MDDPVKIDDPMDVDLDDLIKETAWLKELIECPVCFEIPVPPIRLCIGGHIVCNSCRARTKGRCPLCRKKYSETRNLVAERIVEKHTVQCRHSEIGCKLLIKVAELLKHLKICEFRPFECYSCHEYVKYSEYKRHLENYHYRRFMCLGSKPNEAYGIFKITTKKLKKSKWPQFYMRAFGQIFLIGLRYFKDGPYSSINLWVSLFGPKSESKRYLASIKICNHIYDQIATRQGVSPPEHEWEKECPVHNFRDEIASVIKNNGTLSIPTPQILLMCGGTWTFEFDWSFRIVIRKRGSSPRRKRRPPVWGTDSKLFNPRADNSIEYYLKYCAKFRIPKQYFKTKYQKIT